MTTTERPVPTAMPRLPGQRSALLLTLLLGAAGAGLAALLGDEPQVTGALAGAAIVGGFFLLGSLTTGFVAAHAPSASLMMALLTYTLQVLLLAVVLAAVTGSQAARDTVDTGWLGGTVLVGTLAWTAALVTGALRTDAR